MPATKTKAAEDRVVVRGVRHIIRRLGNYTDDEAGVMSFPDFELYLKETYFDDGWDIEHVEVLGMDKGNPRGLTFDPVNMLYVLVKRAA